MRNSEEKITIIHITQFKELYQEEIGWTKAFEAVIEQLKQEKGEMLYVPAGKYETCSIQLYDNINLYLEAGAELLFIQDYRNYKMVDAEFEGRCKFYGKLVIITTLGSCPIFMLITKLSPSS